MYITIKPYLDTIVVFDWTQVGSYLGNAILAIAELKGRTWIGFITVGMVAVLLTYCWAYADRKVAPCPVCKKKNYGNFSSCARCDYSFYPREIINHKILSIKFNNLDFRPEQIGEDLKERHLADLTPSYIKQVMVKNHFF